jgi:hypothetical protein
VKLQPAGSAAASGPPLGAIFGGVLLLGAGLAGVWLRFGLPRPVCLLHEWTGIPCPTCGSTRLVESLLAGDLGAALAHNPLVFLVLAGTGIWAVVSAAYWLLRRRPPELVLDPREKLALRVAVVLAVLAGWLYLL